MHKHDFRFFLSHYSIANLKIPRKRRNAHFSHVHCWSLIASEKDNILSVLFGVRVWMVKQKRVKLSETWKAWFVRTPAVWKEIKAQEEAVKQPNALHRNMACSSCSGHALTTQVYLQVCSASWIMGAGYLFSFFIISTAVTEEMWAPSITMHKFTVHRFSTGLIKAFPFICGDN